MKRNTNQRQLQKLQQDWEQLDGLKEFLSPSILEIKEQVGVFQTKQKKRFYKELALFFFVAIVTLSAVLLSVFRAPDLFVLIQIGAMIVAPMVLFILLKRKKQKGNTTYDYI